MYFIIEMSNAEVGLALPGMIQNLIEQSTGRFFQSPLRDTPTGTSCREMG
jgi:hypothetical protein